VGNNDDANSPIENRSEPLNASASEVSPPRRLVTGVLDLATLLVGVLAALVAMSDAAAVPMLVADLAPVIAMGSITLAVVVLLHRRPFWAPAVALAAALITAGRVAPDIAVALSVPSVSQSADGATLKVVTVNLWSQNGDGRPFVTFVENERPDVLILQEAYWHWKYYLDRLPAEYRIAAGCELPHQCNSVIVTRLPILTTRQTGGPCCVAATLALPHPLGSGSIEIVGLHLSRTNDRAVRDQELAVALNRDAAPGSRAILAGDLNALPWSTTIRHLDRHSGLERITRFTPSWPTPQKLFPILPIDHIYAGCGWRATSLRRGPDIGSDHYPIIATLAPSTCRGST
jgi:endonuclease/exonuclease/phosphatase (EEP) superfamily protein YafD